MTVTSTTLAGILALCRYIQPQFEDCDAPELPEYITYDDDTAAYPAEGALPFDQRRNREADEVRLQ